MTALLNLALPMAWVVGALIFYFLVKRSEKKLMCTIKFAVSMILITAIYLNIQPSYMPKVTVKKLPSEAIEAKEIEVQDRILKPMSAEERQNRVDKLLTAKEEIKEAIDKNKAP